MRISFILGLAAILCSCEQSDTSYMTGATATQTDDGRYELTWNGPDAPVDVYVAQEPYASERQMRRLVQNDKDGQATIELSEDGRRPYFYVTSNGHGIWTAERLLPLEGGSNFRDVGGYETEDGKRVKWGRLYRSGNMSGLTPSDYEYLSRLGIKVVCDLRTNQERAAMPNNWVKSNNVAYWSRDYDTSGGELSRLLSEGATPERMRAAMMETYERLPYEQAPAYRELFDRLAGGEIPLAFNCTGGKDRVGVGTALILTALGVPRETIIADYALTEKVTDHDKARRAMPPSHALSDLPPELLAPLSASDPDYLRAAFAAIEARSGSIDNFLKSEVGVTDTEIASIRSALLE